jgi:hypothetical protein
MSPQLIAALQASGLEQAHAAAAAISSGATIEQAPHAGPCSDLIPTYQARMEILGRYPSEHACTLRGNVLELLNNLRGAESCVGRWVIVRAHPEYSFNVFVVEPSGAVMGCLRVVSQLQVPAARWQELWHGDAP